MIERDALPIVFTRPLRVDDDDVDDDDDLEDEDDDENGDDEDEDGDDDEPETWQVSSVEPSPAKGCLLLDFGY
jgi:hypothetical protein